MSNKECIFKADTVEAYTVKSLMEVLQNVLTDVCFTFNKDGIKLLTVDNKKPPHLLCHCRLGAPDFDVYHCPKQQMVGINLQHSYKLLKSIKKKDNIRLFINKSASDQLGVTTIQGDTKQPVTSYIKIQKLQQLEMDIPDGYGHPVHIQTSTFQKMCKDMQSLSNTIKIYSKGSYLRFSCEVEGMYTRELPFGELDEDSDEEEYEDIFHTKSLSQLIKVSGLNSRMQVYTEEGLPLKLSINTGQLGKLEIYIKSISQIEADLAATN